MHTVSKELKFEAAHRLVHGYPGNCAHNHGHSWVVNIVVGLRNDRPGGLIKQGLNDYGFVKDYGDFAGLRKWIDDNWDHATLVSSDDMELREWLEKHGQRHSVIPHNPSSEVLSKILFQKAQDYLDDERCRVVEVRIKETCTSEATYQEWYNGSRAE